MRNRTLIVLLLAIACGAVAGYSALQLLQRRSAQVPVDQPSSQMQVVVARRDLPVGQLIGEEDVKLVDWPGDAVPDGYARVIADVVGRGLVDDVRLNEPLLEGKLGGRGDGGGLAIVIPEGMRGYTIRVDEQSGVAGFVDQGTRVDVIVSMQPPNGARNDLVTRIVLQNVEVIARAQNIQRDEQGQPLVVTTVTVAVTPEDLERMAAINMNARFNLALRNRIDVKEVQTPGIRLSSVLTPPGSRRPPSSRSSAPIAVPQTGDSERFIEIFRGGKRALIRF
jgi:pilus assembly protein CpaB